MKILSPTKPTRYDPEIGVRTAVAFAVVSMLATPAWKIPAEVAAAIGAVAGFLADAVLYRIKRLLMGPPSAETPGEVPADVEAPPSGPDSP